MPSGLTIYAVMDFDGLFNEDRESSGTAASVQHAFSVLRREVRKDVPRGVMVPSLVFIDNPGMTLQNICERLEVGTFHDPIGVLEPIVHVPAFRFAVIARQA